MIQFFLTLQRLVRGIAAAWRRDPQFRSLAVLVVFTLLSGTLFYRTVEGWSTVDAFYFSVTTLTTVGLGDIAPSTTFGKLFTAVYIFAGLGLIAGARLRRTPAFRVLECTRAIGKAGARKDPGSTRGVRPLGPPRGASRPHYPRRRPNRRPDHRHRGRRPDRRPGRRPRNRRRQLRR